MTVRPVAQRGILIVSIDDLRKLLGLPTDHQIERIVATENPYGPGIMVTVSGLAMPMAQGNSPLAYESYNRFIVDAESRAERARAHWARMEREANG